MEEGRAGAVREGEMGEAAREEAREEAVREEGTMATASKVRVERVRSPVSLTCCWMGRAVPGPDFDSGVSACEAGSVGDSSQHRRRHH